MKTEERTEALLESALDYAARGWPVFPVFEPVGSGCSCPKEAQCERPGKHPLTLRGFLDATADKETIRAWWVKWPNANPALRTGSESGLVVLDVDVGAGRVGDDSLAELERAHGSLPLTLEVKTGGGGRQLYFRHPGFSVKSVNGILGKNLDVKGDGGYVVTPPAGHVSGSPYAWMQGFAPDECDLAPLPDWISKALEEAVDNRAQSPLDSEQILEGIPQGERDEKLFRYACSLRSQGRDKAEAKILLAEAAKRAKPPFPVDLAVGKVDAAWAKYPTTAKKASARGPSAGDKLIEIALRCELFHDDRRDTYAVFEESGVRRTLRLRSREFRRHLVHTFYRENQGGSGRDAVNLAIDVADAKAVHQGEMHRLEVRFAGTGEEIWIDLVDDRWRAVKVTAAGWEVVDRPPILFRRYSHQNALPEPVAGGNLLDLLDLINLKDEADQILTLSWLVSVPIVTIPRPGLVLHGIKGSGKSCTAKVLRECLDPSALDGLDIPRDPSELAQQLDHTAVPWLDNLSKVHGWQADRLCAAITGGGFRKRELYTDADDILMNFRRTMVITGINIPTSAPDLLDRMIMIELEPPSTRREEAVLWEKFRTLHPSIFGGLLDTLAEAMRLRPGVHLSQPPRMADFARWAAAIAEAMGYGANTFEEIYRANAARQVEEVVSSDPVAAAVIPFAGEVGTWCGTASDLLTCLNNRNDKQKDPEWPRRAAELGKRLKVLLPSLKESGVTVEFKSSHKRGRLIAITDPAVLAKGVAPEDDE